MMYVVATSDCYTINMASAKGKKVWERDITYSAYLVYADGTSTDLSSRGTAGALIQEVLTQTLGQTGTPGPTSPSRLGQPFEDTLSAGNGDTNIPVSGRYKGRHPLCSGGYE